jgi:hypothetical protein
MAGGYRHTKKFTMSDLGIQVRSMWEANVLRVLNYLEEAGLVRFFEYEEHLHIFPGSGATKRKNDRVRLDIYAAWSDSFGPAMGMAFPNNSSGWIEVKGRLKLGGRLVNIDTSPTSQLEGSDHDSRIVLDKFKRHYKAQAERTWLIGEAEYKWLCKRYKSVVPHWDEY